MAMAGPVDVNKANLSGRPSRVKEETGPLVVALDEARADWVRDKIREIVNCGARVEDSRRVIPAVEDRPAAATNCVDAARQIAEVIAHEARKLASLVPNDHVKMVRHCEDCIEGDSW
jgi:hypothetical protein